MNLDSARQHQIPRDSPLYTLYNNLSTFKQYDVTNLQVNPYNATFDKLLWKCRVGSNHQIA